MSIQPIQTYYNGYHFRSRTEARWAVFFDAMGIRYEYEVEGYTLSDGTRYLPDFFLPEYRFMGSERFGIFAEVKHKFNQEEANKCKTLAKDSKHDIILLEGPPDFRDYTMYDFLDLSTEEKSQICEEYDQGSKHSFVFGIDVSFIPENLVHGSMCYGEHSYMSPLMINAINISRSARFEFNGK